MAKKKETEEERRKRIERVQAGRLNERDRLELAQSRAKQRGMTAVETPEGFEEKTFEQAQQIPSVAEQKRLAEPISIEQERIEKAKTFLEEKEFFKEEMPEKVELGVEERFAEGIPVIGKSTSALGGVLANAARKGWLPIFEAGEKGQMDVLMQDPETLREMTLQEIQKEVVKEGVSASESFGSLIESIPVVGSIAHKYATGLIEDPKGNALTIMSEIDSERERASVLAEKVATGKLGDPYIAWNQIEDMENNVARCEQRIKLLADTSAALKADADALHKIEEKIVRCKERIFIVKQAVAQGMTTTSTDASLYLTLQEYKQ